MKRGWKHIGSRLVTLLLVSLIAMLTFNQSMNIHTHVLADGTIITHAHPYNKSNDSAPVKNHHHTLIGFQILHNLQIIFLSVFIAIALIHTAHTIKRNTKENLHFNIAYIHLSPGRAPPALA